MHSAMAFKRHWVWIVTCNDLGVWWDDQMTKDYRLIITHLVIWDLDPGIREFVQNTLLGENDQIWQSGLQRGTKYQKRTGTSDVIFNLARSVHYTDGSSWSSPLRSLITYVHGTAFLTSLITKTWDQSGVYSLAKIFL